MLEGTEEPLGMERPFGRFEIGSVRDGLERGWAGVDGGTVLQPG